jgi:peptide/nickel transport system permease protein
MSQPRAAAMNLDGAAPVAQPAAHRRSRLRRVLFALGRFARRKPLGAFGGAIVIAMMLMAVFAERIAPYGYDETIRGARMKAPGAAHWLGTDNLSRDIWSRVVYGARVSITVGFLTVGLAVLLATAIGVSSAYFGGALDLVIQRVVDAWLSFPYLIIILSVMAVLGPGLANVVVSLAVLIAATNSRVIRSATLGVLQHTYVEAARAMGCGHVRIILRHLLPNVAATIIILVTLGLGAVILAESALSFLGYGVPPPHPTWGGMLAGSGRTYMFRAPWMAVWPGVAISLAVFGFNMLGDALRDVLDPRLRGS